MKYTLIFIVLAFSVITGCSDATIDPPVVDPINPDPDPPAFDSPFAGVPDTKDIAMYEVNMRAFSNEGTFKGVLTRLDSIKALGINVIWLMPIHPIGILNGAGQLGSPYSVKDYKAVNPEYGSLEDLQNLVKEAHSRNMAVIIDWVANHTSWDNAWVAGNPEWYTKDAAGNITIPAGTNWADVADLNYSNGTMRRFMISAMKYWVLKANIDGFRCDYADGVPADFWNQAIDSLQTIPGRKYVLLAEGSQKAQFTAGFAMNYSWDFYNQTLNVFKNNLESTFLYNTHNTEYASVPAGGAKLRYTTNHDQSAWEDSPITFFKGKAGSLSAFVLTAFMGGVPLIYCGQEAGRTDKTPFFSKSPIHWNANPDMQIEYKRLMSFRQSSEAIKQGALQMINDASNVVVFKRVYQGEEVLIFVNTKNSISNYTLPATLVNTNWKNALDNSVVSLSTSVILQPFQYIILK